MKEKSRILEKVKGVKTYSQITSLLKLDTETPTVSHAIFHLKPDLSGREKLPVFFSMFFCSKQIAEEVFTNVEDHSEQKRRELSNWLSHRSEAASFRGWLFEYLAHEKLDTEADLDLKAMGSTYTDVALKIPKGRYAMPKHRNNAAVDAHYLDSVNSKLFLFQITLSKDHPVTVYGLANHIEKEVGLSLDQASNLDSFLVFVVPMEIFQVFSAQKIEAETCPGDKDSVSSLRGIGKQRAKTLSSKNISTVQDLASAIQTGVPTLSGEFKRAYDSYCHLKEHVQEYRFLERLRQYKLGIEF